jgi:MFS transporter, MHS family, proline/betaine transporter
VLAYPAFRLLSSDNFPLIYLRELIPLLPVMVFTGAFSAAVSELFPTQGRFAGTGIGYNVGNALLGATAPTIATPLVHLTGSEIVPAYT